MYVHPFPSTDGMGAAGSLQRTDIRNGWLSRIPVRAPNRIIIVPVASIARLEA